MQHDGKGQRNLVAEIGAEEQLRRLEAMIAKAAFKRRLCVAMVLILTLSVAYALRIVATAPNYYLAFGMPGGLLSAAESGDTRSIHEYAAAGQSMNIQFPWGDHKSSPLCQAALNGRVDSIGALLQCGADPNMPDEMGDPLYWAVFGRSEPAVDALIKGGARINRIPGKDTPRDSGSTAFTTALRMGQEHLAIHLLRLGADPKSMSDGWDALFVARWYGQDQLEAELRRVGAVEPRPAR